MMMSHSGLFSLVVIISNNPFWLLFYVLGDAVVVVYSSDWIGIVWSEGAGVVAAMWLFVYIKRRWERERERERESKLSWSWSFSLSLVLVLVLNLVFEPGCKN